MLDKVVTVVIIICVVIFIHVLLKPFWIKYFDIDVIKKNQEAQLEELKKLNEKFSKNED